MLPLVTLFAIKLFAQVNIFKHTERNYRRKVSQSVRTLERLKGKWYKSRNTLNYQTLQERTTYTYFCKGETRNKIREYQN